MYLWFGKNSFLLDIPSELIISQATQEGKDVGERVSFFYKVLGIGAVFYPLLYFVFLKLKNLLKVNSQNLQVAAVISATGFFLVLSDIIGFESSRSIGFFLVLLALSILLPVLSRLAPNYFRPAKVPVFVTLTLTLSFVVLSTLMLFFNTSAWVTKDVSLAYFIISLIVVAYLLLLKRFTKKSFRTLFSYHSRYLIASLLIFFTVEAVFYFKLKHDFFISYKWLFLGIIGGVALTSFLPLKKKNNGKSSSKLLTRYYAPAALLSFLLLTFYKPVIEHSADIFELANPANAMMNIFKFHQIPLVDFMSSHMLGDQYFGIIYNLIFGYENTQDFMVYIFSFFVIFYFIAYFFLVRIFKNGGLTLLFLIAFPMIFDFFSVNAFFTILTFFLILRLIKKQSFWNYGWVIASILLLIIWKLDTGSTALFTSTIFLPLAFFTSRQKIEWKPLLKGTGISLGVAGLVTLIVILLRSPEYLLANFRSALHYTAANQAHGFPWLAHNYHQQFYFYHLLLPLLSLSAIFAIIWLLRTKTVRHQNTLILNASLFLFIACLMHFQRGLVRHGFFEGSELYVASTFFIASTLLVVYLVKPATHSTRYITFFSVGFLLLVSLKYFPFSKDKTQLDKFMTSMTLVNIDNYFNAGNFKGRIIEDEGYAEENYAELKQFLDKNLTKDQTFLDFSNSPMLYYYCERKVPAYFCQSLQNTVDDYLQLQHLKMVNPDDVPVVVYSNYPPEWFDATDGVPNNMRYYLVAEYIYQNYESFAVMGKRSIWVAKGKNYSWDIEQKDTLAIQAKNYNYKKTASYINRYYEKTDFDDLELVAESSPEPNEHTGKPKVTFPKNVKQLSGVYARLVYDKAFTEIEEQTLYMSDSTGVIGSFTFETNPNDRAYMLRLSNHYLWHIKQSLYLDFEQEQRHLIKVEFYKDTRF